VSFHDSYGRTTPYELAFPEGGAAEELWAAVDEEASVPGIDPWDRQAFVLLGSVGSFLRRLQGPDEPAASVVPYGALLYHSYHFARAGRRVHLLSTRLCRALVDPGATFGAPTLPVDAGYAQLPRHLFWTRPTPEGVPEPVDGVFWTRSPGDVLQSLMATGLREGRAGLAVVPLPEAPWADAPRWARAHVRQEGRDFETTLPGGELGQLYSLERAGEVLKLLARFFGYWSAAPPSASRPFASASEPSGPPATVHPCVRIDLHA
jgi:hypothetical protein